jgi:hypothetical protein
MPFVSPRAHGSAPNRKRRRLMSIAALFSVMLAATLMLAGFAQQQPPTQVPKPLILPIANRVPDANEQMMMREQNAKTRNFAAANTERLKQMMQATDMLETMAIALKAEVDQSGDMSQNTIHKADTIEKLARIVKERMKLTVAPN